MQKRIDFTFRHFRLPAWRGPLLGMFLLALPLHYVPTDSADGETSISASGGAGSYALVSRGCSGEILRKDKTTFRESSLGVDHKFARNPLRIGLRYGHVRDRIVTERFDSTSGESFIIVPTNISLFNPYIHFEGTIGALGIGFFHSSEALPSGEGYDRNESPVSFLTQLGSRSGHYVSLSYLHSAHIYSSGFLQFGYGNGKNRDVDLWFGVSGLGPYDELGFLTKNRFRMHRSLYLDVIGRLGTSNSIAESGFGLGITVRPGK